MLYEIISIAISSLCVYKANTFLLNRDIKKLERSVSMTIKELANSLLSDKGWKYQRAYKEADIYYCDQYYNIALGSSFTLNESQIADVSYEYGVIVKPYLHVLNKEEHRVLTEAVKKLSLMTLRDSRLQLLEKEITTLN